MGKLMIMSSGDRAFGGGETGAKAESRAGLGHVRQAPGRSRRGGDGAGNGGGCARRRARDRGSFACTGGEQRAPATPRLEASVARIEADILALKASLEHTSKTGTSQFNKTSDRLDKLEKAQAEPAAKLAKLSEAVDKLRAAPPAAAAAAPAAAEGSHRLGCAPAAPPPVAAPKVEVGRLPTVEGWGLRDVGHGGALIESRRGNLRGLCRRSRTGSRPDRRDPPAGRPLGGRHQQGPDRRALDDRDRFTVT